MKKTYQQQYEDIKAKEVATAKKHGFDTVEAWREYQAVQNRIRTYEAKIARYERVIAEYKAYIEAHK